MYYTNHPDETAHGCTAVIIRQNIKHYVRAENRHEKIQVTSIAIEDNTGETRVSASTALPNTTINMTITTDFSKHSGTTSLSEEIVMPKTPFGDLDSQLQKEERCIKLCKITIESTFQQDNPPTGQTILAKYRTA